MTSRWDTVAVDALDPTRLARWWAEVLGYRLVSEARDAVVVGPEADHQRLVHELIDWAQRMQRRDILQWLSFAAAAAAAAPVLAGLDLDERERTVAAFASPSRVDSQTIDHIEAVLRRCMRQDDALGPTAAMETTLAQRNLVLSLLPAANGASRDRLLSLYANLLRFAGWLCFDRPTGLVYFYNAGQLASTEST